MTFAELAIKVRALIPGDIAVCVTVDAWMWADGTTGVMWSIWDGTGHRKGESPESAYQALLDARERNLPALHDASDLVGKVEL